MGTGKSNSKDKLNRVSNDERTNVLVPSGILDSVTCGDCFTVLRRLPEDSIDLIVTDPPYAVSDVKTRYTIRNGNTGQNRIRSTNFGKWDFFESPAVYRKWFLAAMEEMLRVLKPGGVIAVFCPDRMMSHLLDQIGVRGHRIINSFVFNKKNPFPLLRKVGFQHALEFGIIAAKAPGRHTFNYTFGYQSNCLTAAVHYPSERRFGSHPAQKPEAVIAPIVKYFSSPGDVVLDPFAGSGTTAVVAKCLDRHFIAIEREPEYARLARRRLAAIQISGKLKPYELKMSAAGAPS